MLFYYVAAVGILFVTHWIFVWRTPRCNGKLPPGSSGVPFIGESLELFIPTYNSFDIQPFIKRRLQKYGFLFRTNIAGHNVIISGDPEFNHFIFQEEEKSVVMWYLDLFEKVFSKRGEYTIDGRMIHKYIRTTVLSQFGMECVKQNLLSQFEQLVDQTLHHWCQQDSVEAKSALVEMYCEFGSKQIYNMDSEKSKQLKDKFTNFTRGLMSFPLNVPGTAYHKCLKESKEVIQIIKEIVNSRIESESSSDSDGKQNDILGKILDDVKSKKLVGEELITGILFGISFPAFETVPSMLTFALKLILQHPHVLQELIEEHEELLKRRTTNSPVTWTEYKSMTYTLQVIDEILRLGNVTPGFLRKTVKDIQVNGYTIPAGWGIMICHSVQHLDPNIFKNPLQFDPSRWKDVDPQIKFKYLIPFGRGMKQCAGAEFARASMSIFIHVLVTKYKWSIVKGGNVVQNPILHFKDGLHINMSERPADKTPSY